MALFDLMPSLKSIILELVVLPGQVPLELNKRVDVLQLNHNVFPLGQTHVVVSFLPVQELHMENRWLVVFELGSSLHVHVENEPRL